jgi:TPR repeat protein
VHVLDCIARLLAGRDLARDTYLDLTHATVTNTMSNRLPPMNRLLLLCAFVIVASGCERAAKPEGDSSLPAWAIELEKLAAAGDAKAQYQLGATYVGLDKPTSEANERPAGSTIEMAPSRKGTPIDESRGVHWLELAAAQGHREAQYELGSLLLPGFDPIPYFEDKAGSASGAPTQSKSRIVWWEDAWEIAVNNSAKSATTLPKDAKKAIHWLTKAAEEGSARAQFKLGGAYASGNGVLKNEVAAAAWWRRAAEQGHSQAQNYLGVMYAYGVGVEKDANAAIAWLSKAAEQGNLGAIVNLAGHYAQGDLVPKNEKLAFDWLLKAAELGSDYAQIQVGWRYYSGTGVSKDLQRAAEWYRRAAEAGSAVGQRQLGLLYRYGEGVPKDASIAFDLFGKAAVQGDPIAQWAFGEMHYNGQGTAKDVVLGYAWINLAAASGDETTLKNRALAEQQMETKDVAEAQRLSSSWKKGTLLTRSGSERAVAASAKNAGSPQKIGSGTLFIVSAEGHGVTNLHVVGGCKEIRLQGRSDVAMLVTSDSVNDLALVKIADSSSPVAPVISEPGKLRQGEEIVVFGFPLNAVLSSGGNLTPGVVSALTGLGNNTNQIQITAPIQPGSSGSPVINKRGEVVGVVSQKLSDSTMAKATGSIGQNVNFAVNGQTLRSFLDANQVKYKSSAGFFAGAKSTVELADGAREWTRVVECWN